MGTYCSISRRQRSHPAPEQPKALILGLLTAKSRLTASGSPPWSSRDLFRRFETLSCPLQSGTRLLSLYKRRAARCQWRSTVKNSLVHVNQLHSAQELCTTSLFQELASSSQTCPNLQMQFIWDCHRIINARHVYPGTTPWA